MAHRLRELRKKHGLTREQLAQESGISYDQLTKLEDASGGGSLETWSDLAYALNEPMEALFASPSPVGAREPHRGEHDYSGRLRGPKPATSTQLKDLCQLAAHLDADEVGALVLLARRLRRGERSL